MTSKYELAISTGYVPDWGVVEATRELFQNAIDNEIENSENEMTWEYKDNTLRISNKTSCLKPESLLLGTSTKSNNPDTIGKHGEGYKIAFMVLLRNKKTIKVYNYGAQEIWEVRLVKCKRYNDELVTTVFVHRNSVFKKAPDSDLTIEIQGITEEEYKDIIIKNLNMREKYPEYFRIEEYGDILLDPEEKGNVYVEGLFIANKSGFEYGYNFKPNRLNLDRDRKLVDTFDLSWEASRLWTNAAEEDIDMLGKAILMVKDNKPDVGYFEKAGYLSQHAIADKITEDFYKEHGDEAIPVTTSEDYEAVKSSNAGKPIIVNERMSKIIGNSTISLAKLPKKLSVKEQLQKFVAKIEGKLTDEELEELNSLIVKVEN